MSSAILNPGWSTNVMAGAQPGKVAPEDEFLHPVPDGSGYAWTETSYWGFCVPERGLMAEIYIWFHPVLNVMSAGILMWTGFRASSLAADYVNHHHFLPLPESISNYRIEALGLEIEILEPLSKARLTLSDPQRGVHFDIVAEGALPPISRPNGHHLVQPMHTVGTVDLYGERIAVDGYFMRDRSWGAERHETSLDLPPITWMTGMARDFSFHLVAFDEPGRDPHWRESFSAPSAGDNLVWGYVHKDGQTHAVVRADKLTRRADDGCSPAGFDMDVEDSAGRRLHMVGEVTARAPWATWQNVVVHYALTRWTIGNITAWGDCQDIQYNRFVHEFSR